MFDSDPIAHELREIFGLAIALRHKRHAHALVLLRRLEHERGVEVELRRHAHLAVWVERELDAEDRRNCLLELVRFGRENLSND